MSAKTPFIFTEQEQYQAIKQTLTRAEYDHEAYVEDRPKVSHGSMVLSFLNGSTGAAGGEHVYGGGGLATGAGTIATHYNNCSNNNNNNNTYGAISSGAASIHGGMSYSPISPGTTTGSIYGGHGHHQQQKRYSRTVRSNASSILSLGRQKTEPPVMMLSHYNSPYEAIYFNQPEVTHFVGKDLRIGTVCVSARPGEGVTHVLVRTVLKFANFEIPDSMRSSAEFEHYRTLYPKKGDIYAVIHIAVQYCLESIPDIDMKRHQVIQHQSAADHSAIVLDEPGWMKSPRYISNIVKCLEEIRQEGFTHVLKNLEAQMKPGALMADIVIPELADGEQEKFWAFFNGLGDHIEEEIYLPEAPRARLNLPVMIVGNKTEDHRMESVTELIQTEKKYNERMKDLVHIYLAEAKASATSLNPALGKYEIRVIFSNIEQILAVSSAFLKDLQEYEKDASQSLNLGDICARNLRSMGCYKQYLMRYKRAQDTYTTLSRKLPAFKALLEKCVQANNIATLNNLLVEPTQRIVKYPLLFKGILSGTKKESPEVEGIVEAAELASQIAHMEKAKPEQTAEMLFNLRNTIENCPDALVSQNRSIVSYLDAYETNLLTGERGKSITLILFSDKVMIVRRPKGVSGETLFQLKEDVEERKRREKENKERREREKTLKKDDTKRNDTGSTTPTLTSTAPGPLGTGAMAAAMMMFGKDWKFMGWMDILKLKVAIVEQTDPEGLFCITTRNHTESKDGRWETTRGILPEFLDKRDSFISKFHETLSLKKAAAAGCGADYTSRLHVAELELFCNVFSESQYRDFKNKGDVALFYAHGRSHPIDVAPFTRLPTFVGMIQATDSGMRAVLRSKLNLNDIGDPALTTEDANRFMDVDSFQIHITELIANLQWVTYQFDPYQSAQLHFSRVYLDTDYLYQTAAPYLKATTLRTKGLKKIRDTTASVTSARSSSVLSPYASSGGSGGGGGHHHPSQYTYRNGGGRAGSFSPLANSSGILASPSTLGGGVLGRYGNAGNVTSNYGSTASFSNLSAAGVVNGNSSSCYDHNSGNANNNNNNNHNNGDGGAGGMTMAAGSVKNTSALSPSIMQQKHPQYLKKRTSSVTVFDGGPAPDNEQFSDQQQQQQPPLYPNQQLSVSTLRNSLTAMNLLLPGPRRKKDEIVEPVEWVNMLIETMECQAGNRLLDDLLTAVEDQRTIRKLFNLVHCSEIELMRLELQNYSAAVAFEILRIYLQESYECRPLVPRKTVGDVFGAFLGHRRALQVDDEERIFQLSQIYLGGGMDSQSRAILGVILAFYMRMQAQLTMEEHSELLATKISTLVFSPEVGDDHEGHGEGKAQGAQVVSDDDILWIMEVWTLLYPHLWPSEATLPPPSPTSTSITVAKSASTSRLTRDSSVRSVDSVSSTAVSTYTTTTNASTISAAITGMSVVGDGVYERVFATWPGEPPRALKGTMEEKDKAVHEAISYHRTIQGLRLYIQNLRDTICEAFSKMAENADERHLGREDLSPTKGHAEGNNGATGSLIESMSPRDLAKAIASVAQTDLEAGDDTDNSLRRCWSVGALGKESSQPSILRTLSLARNPHTIIISRSSSTSSLATISASRLSHDDEATGNLSAHGQLYQVLRATKSQPSMGSAKKQRDERPLPLTPVQQEQMQLRHDVSDVSVGADAEEDAEEDGVSGDSDAETRTGVFEHPLSVETESSFENGASTVFPLPPSPQQPQHASQKQRVGEMYLMAGRHLELLDECMEAVEAQREEVAGKLDGMVARYEELVRQFVLATEYQVVLEHENEAIRELYAEVTEENNVIFERFNEELEGVFKAVNVPPVEQDKETVEDGDCVEVLEDGKTTEDELRRLLHKAIQDRTMAEQKARQATLQTNYYKNLLERHGIQADAMEIFQPQEDDMR